VTDAWLLALEAAGPVQALRESTWVYPLVSAGHILGIGLLVGSVLPLDARLLGAWRQVPVASLWRVLTASALAGLTLAVICGVALFAVNAGTYAQSSLFGAKLLLIALGIANAVWLRVAAPAAIGEPADDGRPLPWQIRSAAGVSIIAWIGALLLGRLIAYF
jgi:hypothetical protein